LVENPNQNPGHYLAEVVQSLEAMILEGWVTASYNPKLPLLRVAELVDSQLMSLN